MPADTVDTQSIADLAITEGKLNNDAVTTNKIADSNVTTGKLANGAATPTKRSGGFKVGNFTISSTGNVAVTGVGFLPKAVIFFTAGQAGAALLQLSIGATDGTSSYVAGGRGAEGGDISGGDTATAVIWTQTANAGNDVLATLVSLDSDGFTVNASVAGSTAIVGYLAIA